ncbi:MAG: AhpC/TSA family protein [Paludibacter sp.]|jgi:thiol-disulfide isomerase/thioredoxin|nr:AhpC/TSA family protein [Paludibacter sp.]
MKTKILFVFFLFPLCLFAQSEKYCISGVLPDSLENTVIYLSQVYPNNDRTNTSIDSAFVADGKFEFRGNVKSDDKNVYQLYSEKYPNIIGNLILETGNINIRIDTNVVDGNIPLYADGTPLNKQITDIFIATNTLAKLVQAMMADGGTENLVYKMKEKQEQMRPVARKMYDDLVSFVKANAANAAGEYIFLSLGTAIKEKEMNEILPLLSDEISQKYSNRQNNISKITVGQKYLPFTATTLTDEIFNLADIVGKKKYILLDFWASWCKPCIKEMPNLALLNEKYKEKGLEIVSISTDTDAKQWKNAIDRQKMSWLQVIDSKSITAQMYDVYAIPATFLIDSKGNIIAKDVRGNDLIKLIEKLLKI